jgi:hypothetical protein
VFLVAERTHPRAAALRWPRKIVAIEQTHMRVHARDFPHAHVRVIDGNVVALADLNAEQSLRGIKRRLDHFRQLQIGHDLGFIEIEAGLAQPLGIVAPIPGGELKIAAFFGDERLQRVALFGSAGLCGRPHVVEQFAGRRGRLRHRVGEAIIGEAFVAQQARAPRAQFHDAGDQRLVVVRAAIAAAACPGLEELFPQIAPAGELQERFGAGARGGDGIFRLDPALDRGFSRRVARK